MPATTEFDSVVAALIKRVAALEDRPPGPSTTVLDNLLTPGMLAESIGQTERTLSEWRINGNGPSFIRLGRAVRYRPEAVDAWLLSREHRSTAEEVR